MEALASKPRWKCARGWLKVLRAGAWFEYTRHYCHAPTAYAAERHYQPASFHKRVGEKGAYHHNHWIRYATGSSPPHPATVQQVASRCPGSDARYEAVLWSVLDTEYALQNANEWLRQLDPDIQKAIYHQRRKNQGTPPSRRPLRDILELLQAQANNWDAIAALVILLREADAAGQREHCLEIGYALHAAVLMAGTVLPVWRIFPELMLYLARYVFPLTHDQDRVIAIDFAHELAARELFWGITTILEDAGRIPDSNGGSTRNWLRVIDGEFGFDLLFAFSPTLVALPTASRESRAALASAQVFRDWGWQVLEAGRVEQDIPKAVREAAAAARHRVLSTPVNSQSVFPSKPATPVRPRDEAIKSSARPKRARPHPAVDLRATI